MNLWGWDISLANLGSWLVGVAGLVTAVSATRKVRIEHDDSVTGGYRNLTESQGAVFDRVIKRLEQVELRVSQLETEKKALEQQVDDRDQRITELEIKVTDRDARITALEAEVQRLKDINSEAGKV